MPTNDMTANTQQFDDDTKQAALDNAVGMMEAFIADHDANGWPEDESRDAYAAQLAYLQTLRDQLD